MDDSHSACEKTSWQHDLLLSFLLHSRVQESTGGTWLCFCSGSRLVLLQLCWAIRESQNSHAWFPHFFSSFLGYPGWRAEVIHNLMCLNFCPTLSRVFSAWQVTIQATTKPCLLFFLSWVFPSTFFIRLLLVRRLRAVLAQIRTVVGRYFQSVTKL